MSEHGTTAPHLSPAEFRALGHRAIDWIADYHERIERFPVLSQVKPGDILGQLPEHPPQRGIGGGEDSWDAVFGDLDKIIVPGLTHWQSPSFFGYFPCNSSGPGMLGEMLSGGLNVIGMLWATSPAATELEMRVMDWMAEILDLPGKFRFSEGTAGGGVIQGTASDSTLVAMLAARQRLFGGSPSRANPPGELVAYASSQAHSSVVKAAMVAGVADGAADRRHVRLIDVDESFAMRADLLEQAMREDAAAGRRPFFVCATAGTTSSTAVDSVEKIAAAITRVAAQSGGEPVARPWLHVDAALAGAACVCPEFRWMLAGIEYADSLCFNPHKWLLTNFDCDCFWTSDRAALINALSITPEYLRNRASETGEVIDYRDWQIPLGRRFRALKLWLVIRHYGVEGLRAHIREHVRLAALLESWVREDDRFEVVAPRVLNLVCLRLRGEGKESDDRNRALLERLNASGKLLLTHTSLRGPGGIDKYVLRMAIGATATREEHVRAAWEFIRAAAGDARVGGRSG